ncbi:MAG: tetratricopeptide repeat protein [Candidatus Omnitrophica bacterium]|nr:tetratricopeptide repeat protein [Candidatus Omnitrophota bacterium]
MLLGKGQRFAVEFALLALPLLKANPPVRPGLLIGQIPKRVYLTMLGLLMLMPMSVVARHFSNRPAYPFSPQGLPQGIVTFLNRLDVGGRVLNYPDSGGYLQWMVSPKHRIFMDMEVPFLFTDEDMYLAQNMFIDEVTLGKVLSRYDPAFITVRNTTAEFPALIKKFPEYVLVWFDDAEVLYVNQRQHPAIAAAYQLDTLNPFSLPQESVETVLKSERDQTSAMQELHRLLMIDPDGKLANHLAGLIYLRDGAYDRVLPHAQAIISHFPESPMGYRLQGDALKGLRAFDQALAAYRSAMERSDPSHQVKLHKNIGLVYVEQGKHAQAYEALARAMNVFSGDNSVEDLYHLGSSAAKAGKPHEAASILTYLARYKLAPDQTAWVDTLKRDLARLGVEATMDQDGQGKPSQRGAVSPLKSVGSRQ